MQMNDLRRPCLLVQVVHVLRHHHHVVAVLQRLDELMALVGLGRIELLAEHVVEICHQCGVGLPTLMRGNLLHRIVLPQAVIASERLETTLHRHAGTGEKHYLLLLLPVHFFIVCHNSFSFKHFYL